MKHKITNVTNDTYSFKHNNIYYALPGGKSVVIEGDKINLGTRFKIEEVE